MPPVYRSMRAMFSMISSNRRAGSLEGTDQIPFDPFTNTRPQRAYLHQIDLLSEKVAQPMFQMHHIQQ